MGHSNLVEIDEFFVSRLNVLRFIRAITVIIALFLMVRITHAIIYFRWEM